MAMAASSRPRSLSNGRPIGERADLLLLLTLLVLEVIRRRQTQKMDSDSEALNIPTNTSATWRSRRIPIGWI